MPSPPPSLIFSKAPVLFLCLFPRSGIATPGPVCHACLACGTAVDETVLFLLALAAWSFSCLAIASPPTFLPFYSLTTPTHTHAYIHTNNQAKPSAARHTPTQATMSSFADPEDLEPQDTMEEEVQQEEEEDDGVPRSVLQESIKRKGVNSYYYAHSRKNSKLNGERC